MVKFLLAPLLAFSLLSPFKFIGHLLLGASPTDIASSASVRITGEVMVQGFFGEPFRAHYSCTGFHIAPLRILTAAHCVGEKMQADGFEVQVLKKDVYYDLALLSTEHERKFLTLRDEPVVRDEALTAIGYGFGWTSLTILKERVMLVNYSVVADAPVGMIVQGGYIGGMSGGPVIDSNGYVVSIVQRGNAQIGYGVGTLLMKAFLLGESGDGHSVEPTMESAIHNLLPIPFIAQ